MFDNNVSNKRKREHSQGQDGNQDQQPPSPYVLDEPPKKKEKKKEYFKDESSEKKMEFVFARCQSFKHKRKISIRGRLEKLLEDTEYLLNKKIKKSTMVHLKYKFVEDAGDERYHGLFKCMWKFIDSLPKDCGLQLTFEYTKSLGSAIGIGDAEENFITYSVDNEREFKLSVLQLDFLCHVDRFDDEYSEVQKFSENFQNLFRGCEYLDISGLMHGICDHLDDSSGNTAEKRLDLHFYNRHAKELSEKVYEEGKLGPNVRFFKQPENYFYQVRQNQVLHRVSGSEGIEAGVDEGSTSLKSGPK